MNRVVLAAVSLALACASPRQQERAPHAGPAAAGVAQRFGDLVAAVPGPPAPGSDEGKADIAIVLWMQRTRTPAEVERARVGARLGIEAFAPALGPGFDPGGHPRTRALLQDARKRAREPLHAAKDRFRRARPYDAD